MKYDLKEYITSDLHLFHTNIIKYADRTQYQESNTEDTIKMNWDIVNYINDEIPDKSNVVLWNLGDVLYGKLLNTQTLEELQELIGVMKGEHRTLKLILGNHDKQFKQFAKWEKLKPLDKNSSLQEIFSFLGFGYIYEYPIIMKDKFILSHEPIYLKPSCGFINIHGHTHQKFVGPDYFTWKIENRDMVLKAYHDSNRKCPNPDAKKDNCDNLTVDDNQYINVCWDSCIPRVFDLNCILSSYCR